MLNRWYRKDVKSYNPNYVYFQYRNLNLQPLIKQVQVEYNREKKHFIIEICFSSIFNQRELIKCFKTVFTEEEFNKVFDCIDAPKISIRSRGLPANSDSLSKIIKVFDYINKKFPQEISVEMVIDIRNIFSLKFNINLISNIPLWQETTAYVNPLRQFSNKLAFLTEDYTRFPKKINPKAYFSLLREGENPNQKNNIGQSILFLLADDYHRLKHAGYEYNVRKLIYILVYFGAKIFDSENGVDGLSAAEVLDILGYPQVFREIIMANSRVERPLNIKSVQQSMNNGVITTEFTFKDPKKDAVITKLLSAEQFKKDQAMVDSSYVLFSQNFEAPDGSLSKVKQEFENAFLSNKKDKIMLVEGIYIKNQMVGCVLIYIHKNSKDVNIEYAFTDPEIRSGLMTILVFRIGFCLAILNPTLQPAVLFSASHANSFKMIAGDFFYPKFNVMGAEEIMRLMYGDNVSIHKEELQVIGGYFAKQDFIEMIFYEYFMGFKRHQGMLIPPASPISAVIVLRLTSEFFKRLIELSKIHGVPYEEMVTQLAGHLPKIDDRFAQSSFVPCIPYVFPKAISLFASPVEPVNSFKNIEIKSEIRSKL